MIYSTYKLNKQVDSIHPDILLSQFWTSPLFHVWFFLTCIQVSHTNFSGIPIYKNHPQFAVIHTVIDFSIVNEAEVDFF